MKRIRIELATIAEEYVTVDVVRKVVGQPIVLEVPVEDCGIDLDAREKVRRALQKLVDEA